MRIRHFLTTLFVAGILIPVSAGAQVFEVFAKGSFSKNNIEDNEWETSVVGEAGVAVVLIPRIRIEGRYTNQTTVQNTLVAPVGNSNVTLSNIMTETSIISLGIDVDLFGDKYAFQPYVYMGAGYVTTSRSYYVITDPTQPAAYLQEPRTNQLSGNLGAGLRIHLGRALALELEAFAYGIRPSNPNPLTNLYGTVGIRIFI